MRDLAAIGYTVGVLVHDVSEDPCLISSSNDHIMAYDLECEYLGPATADILAPILCACLKCSCGYEAIVSRVPILSCKTKCVVAPNNALIAETCDRLPL
jgi:hypothetical protein